jgi:predicted 2-oxoglutarate/Fe(II)-dependent dioxygenase YbiX/peroxiredoxin
VVLEDAAVVAPTVSQDQEFAALSRGDPMPWFDQRCRGIQFSPDSMAGRYLVFCFYGSAADPLGLRALETMRRHRAFFDDDRASFFGVSIDPQDESLKRVRDADPGIRFMWDFDLKVSKLFGSAPVSGAQHGMPTAIHRFWMIIDPTLRMLSTFPIGGQSDGAEVFPFLDRLPHPSQYAGFDIPAPILVLPNIFEPQLRRRLIDLYDADGGRESGVMRDSKAVIDASFKRRRDYHVTDQNLIKLIQRRILARAAPEIEKLFFMKPTRMERYIVGCYAADHGGHFRPHRDNRQRSTAHRRFAVSINLNGDFDGGAVIFAEYNRCENKAPPGWGIIFPCAILHQVTRVTRGRRYAFLPFLYDEAGAKIRAANLQARPPMPSVAAENALERNSDHPSAHFDAEQHCRMG